MPKKATALLFVLMLLVGGVAHAGAASEPAMGAGSLAVRPGALNAAPLPASALEDQQPADRQAALLDTGDGSGGASAPQSGDRTVIMLVVVVSVLVIGGVFALLFTLVERRSRPR